MEQPNIKIESDAVFFVKDSFVKIGNQEINFLKEKVSHNNRKSIRLCMHTNIADSVHEMFILHSRETYIRPHKHPNKDVSYHIIEGIMDMVVFDEKGVIVDVIPMGEYGTGRHFYYRLNEVYYYTPLVRSDFLLFHETINGPFKPSDTIYAPWAVVGDDPIAAVQFQKELVSKVDAFLVRRTSLSPHESTGLAMKGHA